MKPCQVLGKYFEVYGQGNPITPEAGEKKAPFWNRQLYSKWDDFWRFYGNSCKKSDF